jgi:peptidoglycan/LPS O-acetylase OafA/YrhL
MSTFIRAHRAQRSLQASNSEVQTRQIARQGYLPTLDGWRAIAIIAVVFHHDWIDSLGPLNTKWLYNYGWFGVDIFFAISGLLICSRLLEEEKMQGHIHLRKFYIRRAFRILPPAITYLAVIGALGLASAIPVARKEWLSALFFCRNISQLSETLGYRGWYTGHFWSLAVEEHFYLILPAFLVFTPKRWRLTIMTAMALLFAAWRLYFLPFKLWHATLNRTDMRLDELWVPAIFAILLTVAGPRRILEAIARFWVVPAAVLIYLLISSRFRAVAGLVGYAGMPLILLGTVLRPSSYLGRFLELSPLRWVGRVSYSIYLWQELFFTGHFLQSFGLSSLFAYWPIRYICLVACASASYYFVEKPLMKIGHRLAPPPTPGRIDTETQVAGIEAHGYPTIKIPALDPR